MFPPYDHIRQQLRIFEDESGILRCRGRYKFLEGFDPERAFPTFIPRQSQLLILMIRKIHLIRLHCGPTTLMADFRLRYWTPQLRQLIRYHLFIIFLKRNVRCASASKQKQQRNQASPHCHAKGYVGILHFRM